MSKFQNYMKQFDIASNVTEDEVEKAEELLQLYSPLLRRAAQGIDDMEDFCVDSRRQSISDFITLAIDYDHDGDSKRIADRLAAMGHSMQLLSLMYAALVLVKADSLHGKRYYDILRHAPTLMPILHSNRGCVSVSGHLFIHLHTAT